MNKLGVHVTYLAHPSQSKSRKISEKVGRYRLKTNMDEINWSNDCYCHMLTLDFDSLFSTVDLESFSHLVIDIINW